jgi:hypothetical protein
MVASKVFNIRDSLDVDRFTFNPTNGLLTLTGTMAATTVTGANVTSGEDPGHTHTAYEPILTDTLTLESSAGDASLFLKADTSNTVESANPFVRLEQDGNIVVSVIGMTGAANIDAQGSTFTNMANNGLAIRTSSALGMGVGTIAGFTLDHCCKSYFHRHC